MEPMATNTKPAPRKTAKRVTTAQPDLFASAPTTTQQLLEGAGVAAADNAPPNHFGVAPKILNEGDLEIAVRLIAWLRSRESTINERTKQAKALIDATAAKDFELKVDDQTTTIPEYITKLWKACLDYSSANRERIFGEAKTRTLPHGTLKFAFKPESVAFDGKEAELVDRLIGELKLRSAIAELQAKFDKTGFLRMKVELDRDGIKAGVKAGTLKLSALEKRGIRLDRDEDFKVTT